MAHTNPDLKIKILEELIGGFEDACNSALSTGRPIDPRRLLTVIDMAPIMLAMADGGSTYQEILAYCAEVFLDNQ